MSDGAGTRPLALTAEGPDRQANVAETVPSDVELSRHFLPAVSESLDKKGDESFGREAGAEYGIWN